MIAHWKAAAVIVAIVANTINLFVLGTALQYFDVILGILPFALNIVVAFMGVWMGRQIGDFIAQSHKWGILDVIQTSFRLWLINGAMIAGVIIFLLGFILTANPPTVSP